MSAVHDPKWVSEEDRFIMYNNNIFDPTRGLSGGNSMVLEIEPPINPDGSYVLAPSGVYGPVESVMASDLGVEAGSVGTAQRLNDGRTLSCDCTNSLAIWLDDEGQLSKHGTYLKQQWWIPMTIRSFGSFLIRGELQGSESP